MQSKSSKSRGAVQKSNARAILVYFPLHLIPAIDVAVQALDTDRSKFVRQAVREKLDSLVGN